MAYATLDLINWAKICQPLARYGEAKKTATTGASIDNDLDIKLAITRADLEYEYNQDSASENLFPMGNYLLTLMGIYLFEAQQATGSGGSISPITTDVSVPDILDFIVDGGTLIATGAASVYLNGGGGRPDLRGYNVNFARNGTEQYTTNPGDGSQYFYWDKVTGLFQLLPLGVGGAALAGDRMRIMPDTGAVASSDSAATTSVFPFVVPSANFEADGVTLLDSRITGNTVYLQVNNTPNPFLFAPTDFIYVSGGIQVVVPGFNSNSFSYTIVVNKIV